MAQTQGAVAITTSSPQAFDGAFLDVPNALYRDIAEYRAPLKMEIAKLLKAGSPYTDHADARYFIARRGEQMVGRLSAQVDRLAQDSMGPGTGQFGYFECEDNLETAQALFSAAEQWLKAQGMSRSVGPFNPSINEEVGILIEGFDTPNSVLMPHGQPHYQVLLDQLGYDKVKELIAYDFDVRPPLGPKFQKMVELFERNEKLEFRHLDMKNFARDVDLALDIFNDAWRNNWGFTPMTGREAQRFRSSLRMIMSPKLAGFALYDGKPISFMFVLPDINVLTSDFDGNLLPFNWAKLLYRLRKRHYPHLRTALLGTLQEHQNTRLGGLVSITLIELIRRQTAKFGATHAELSWILEDNKGINNMLQSIGGRIYKRYGMFEKAL